MPPWVEVLPVFWSEAGVVEDQPRTGVLRLQLESSDGVKPLRPLCEPPRLDDPLIRNQLNVSSYHAATETIECPPASAWIWAGLAVNALNCLESKRAS